LKETFTDRLRLDRFEIPVNCYLSLADNSNLQDEKKYLSTKEAKSTTVLVLNIGQTRGDCVCRTDLICDAEEAGLMKGVEEKVVQAGH